MTYNVVCHNFYIDIVKNRCKRSDCYVGVCYVMLCYMLFYLSIYIYQILIVYKLYDIPYSMLCYWMG